MFSWWVCRLVGSVYGLTLAVNTDEIGVPVHVLSLQICRILLCLNQCTLLWVGGIQLLQLDTFKQLFMAFDGMHLLRMCCLNCQAIWLLRASCTHWLSQAGLVTCLQGFNRAGAMLAPTMHCVNSLTFVSILIIGTVHT